jgi:hypothetical protein
MSARAVTPAGRGSAERPPSGSRPAHRRKVAQPVAPRAPRRVSGPSGGRAAVATAAAPAVAPQISPRPAPRPRVAPRPKPTTAPRARPRTTKPAGLGARALATIRALPDHSLLDRLVRGRAWIPILGVMLAGIVAMQVEVLKLNASIGRSLELTTTLQNTNDLLHASVASLADDQRIERLAAGMGMITPAPEQVGFLSSGPGVLSKALGNIHSPDPGDFVLATTSNGAIVTAASVAAANNTPETQPVTPLTPGSPTPDTSTSSSTQSDNGSTATTTTPTGTATSAPTDTTSTPSSTPSSTQSSGPTDTQQTPTQTTAPTSTDGAAAVGGPTTGQTNSTPGG